MTWALALALATVLAIQDGVAMGDVELANKMDEPALQGQAMEKVFSAGAAAVPAIEEFVERKGWQDLTLLFTQRLARIRDARLAELLARLIRNKDFFWRPAATWALAEQGLREHVEIFRQGLSDHLWGVREASIVGLENLDDRASLAEIKKLLADPVYAVRAQSAKTLYEFGDETGLPVLVAALRDSTGWFGIDYGQHAREDAFNYLKRITGLDFGYKGWESSRKRDPAARKWEEWIAGKFPEWRKMVPETAWPQSDAAEYLFGFELRSCQRGDFLFRIDTEGRIVKGDFNLIRRQLTPEELESVKKAVQETSILDPMNPPGRPGCDFEKYYILNAEGGYDSPFVYVRGRPAELDDMIRLLRDLIRKHFGPGEGEEFRTSASLFREPD